MTYPDATVARTINENFVPVQLDVETQTEQVDRYDVIWTPNIYVIDAGESVYFHLEGWLSPPEYAAMLHCARGHYFLHMKRLEEAVQAFQKVFACFPGSEFAPQALYYAAVGKYLGSHNTDDLMQGWKDLQRYHPNSSWAYRTHL